MADERWVLLGFITCKLAIVANPQSLLLGSTEYCLHTNLCFTAGFWTIRDMFRSLWSAPQSVTPFTIPSPVSSDWARLARKSNPMSKAGTHKYWMHDTDFLPFLRLKKAGIIFFTASLTVKNSSTAIVLRTVRTILPNSKARQVQIIFHALGVELYTSPGRSY